MNDPNDVDEPCPECGGEGVIDSEDCPRCEGSGILECDGTNWRDDYSMLPE